MPVDVPLFKTSNPEVMNFLLKYTWADSPDKSAVRRNCLHNAV